MNPYYFHSESNGVEAMNRGIIYRSILTLTALAMLTGCAGEDISGDLTTPRPRGGSGPGVIPGGGFDLSAYLYVLVASDREGNVNFFGDNGLDIVAPILHPVDGVPYVLSLANDLGEPYGLGEVVHASDSSGKHWLFVMLSSGVLDENQVPVGGGIAKFDMHTLATPEIIPLRSDLTALPSRPGRATLAPDGLSLWVTNSGPEDDPSTTDVNEAEGDDTLFVVNIDDPLAPMEVPVGDGPNAGAFALFVDGGADVNNWYVNINGPAQTVTVLDYTDPMNPMQVGDVLDLNAHLPPRPNGTLPKRNLPEGVAYSPFNGKFYIGVSQGSDVAVATIDAKMESGDTPVLDVDSYKSLKKGGLIPAAGYVKTSTDGRWVFTTGWLKGATPADAQGYLSVIDASTDMVTDVVPLGNLASSSFNLIEDGLSIRLYIAGADRVANESEFEGILNAQVALVSIDMETGMRIPNDLGEDVTYIDVAKGADPRDMAMTTGGEHLFVPGGNARECQEVMEGLVEPGLNGCSRISVVDTATNFEMITVDTFGMQPTWLGVFETALFAGEAAPIDGAPGGDHH